MDRLKRILRWTVGIFLCLYLSVILLLSLPFIQNWMGHIVSSTLSDQLGCQVEVGRVQMGLTGRLLIDDISITDRQNKEMLKVTRTGARIAFLPLIKKGDIHIYNALLFGAHAQIYQQHPDSALNCQFIIDALKSDEQEKKPMPHISIGSVLVRHTSASFDQNWKKETPNCFNPSHVKISDLSLAAQLDCLTDDSLSLELRKMSFKEQGGFELSNLKANVERDRDDITISNLSIELPNSKINVPSTRINLAKNVLNEANGSIEASIAPSDFQSFYKPLTQLVTQTALKFSFSASQKRVKIEGIKINSNDNALSVDIPTVEASHFNSVIPSFNVQARHIKFTPAILDNIKPLVASLPAEVEPLIKTLGETSLQGNICWEKGQGNTNATLTTKQGQLSLMGTIDGQAVQTKVSTNGFDVGKVLSAVQKGKKSTDGNNALIGKIAFNAESKLTIPTSFITIPNTGETVKNSNERIQKLTPQLPQKGASIEKWMTFMPKGNIKVNVNEARIKNYTYRNINLNVDRKRDACEVEIASNDPSVDLDFHGNILLSEKLKTLQGLLEIDHLKPQDLQLTKSGINDVRTKVGFDLSGADWETLNGHISIPHVIITDDKGPVTLTNFQLQSLCEGSSRDISFLSPYVTLQTQGDFYWKDLIAYMQHTIHNWMPGIVNAPKHEYNDCQANIDLSVIDPSPLERLANIPLRLGEGPIELHTAIKSKEDKILMNGYAPCISFQQQDFLNFNIKGESNQGDMATRISIGKMIKGDIVDFALHLGAKDQMLTTRFEWDDHLPHVTRGALALRGNFLRDNGKLVVNGEILPTSFQISDTLWNVRPTRLTFRDDKLNVEDFRVTMEDGNRWLAVQGDASKNLEDTMYIDVRGIELGYIFDFMHVKPVHMGGLVTGKLYGVNLFTNPLARGHITVPRLYLNSGHLGYCEADLTWGEQPGNLGLDVHVKDEPNNSWIEGRGYLHLIKDPYEMLDLTFETQRANLYLINRYTEGIIEDMEGRATGNLHVYGTFANVNLTGEAIVNEAAVTIPTTNVRYHLFDQPLKMYTDGVEFKNIVGYDPQGAPGIAGHQAILDGRINYRYFRDMTFDFTVTGDNILAYNFSDFGDMPFCGIVYGSGEVKISGSPGKTNIDLHARPNEGTQITYKVESPTTLTQSKFITFVDRKAQLFQETSPNKSGNPIEENKPSGDMYINFDLDINPEAELRLLMDAHSGDYISLFGNSRLRAYYYNKGDFRMYGTYRVDHGIYRMSFQDVIRKEFQFKQDGTIIFGGDPYQADLGLQAIYTVPSVSLNDLSARGTFSNSNVRVNCIMNLGGKAFAPRITFDFDIPNVNDDERRMVRSLISTEEERNLQVIYLLGIGRFYTYDFTDAQQQSTTAMNSLLSSTLSGQLNQMFNTLMGGNRNWNIGANLSTGEMGWKDMDVEGMLSGRLLNNRLLINGSFGYRDNPVAASNFIGDFDLQWVLNKRGNFILKAYSETNDRYFTKSALTTQGVGLLLKKDFVHWTDLFKFKK